MSDLENAKRKVDQQTRQADRRSTMAERIREWYREQAEENGFRQMIDKIVGDR